MSSPQNKTLIHVSGPSYSGTTMLDLMLGNADDAFSCGEVYSWYRPCRDYHARLDCPCGQDPCPAWTAALAPREDRFHVEAFDRLGKSLIVDSSKNLPWMIDADHWLKKAGARDVRVFHLLVWKDPISHAYSHWKRGTSLKDARHRFVRYYQRYFSLKRPFVGISHARFSADPAGMLARLCGLVGLDYTPGREQFWTRTHHNLYGNDGTRRQSCRGQSSIRPESSYPAEFVDAYESFEGSLRGDPERRVVLATLDDRALERLTPADLPGTPGRFPLWPPGWYIAERQKRRIRAIRQALRPRKPEDVRPFFSPELPHWRKDEAEAGQPAPHGTPEGSRIDS